MRNAMDNWMGRVFGSNDIVILIAAICIVAVIALIVIYIDHMRTNRIMDSLEYMVDKAVEGSFTETRFDETKLSALETKLAEYLASSELSARNIADEKNRIKELTSDISHQTKTPVANLMLYSELLWEADLPEEAHSYAKSIHAQSEKMRFLIDSLVKLSRLEAGVFTLHPQKQKIQPMLEKLVNQYEPAAQTKKLKLTFSGSTDLEAVFDRKWTEEAIGNVIDNSIKYTEHGGITISVKAYTMFTCIRVQDTGIGISEDEKVRIFSRFYRSEKVRNVDGVGIGLYLSREILSKESGYIKVGGEGRGARFDIFLPNTPADQQHQQMLI